MLDLVIGGGLVVDGTGGPAGQADIGIRDGRVVTLAEPGAIDEPARDHIAADGLVVAPGFVDIHTHYDAQLFWDPTASPSPLHGVTTVIGGNCGFTLAPADPDHVPYLMRMMARVEGMPLTALEHGVPWKWESFADYLDALGSTAVNAGFLVGHSALRRAAMGERAVGEPATPDDVAAMCRTLHEALAAGGLGFSSSQSHTHNDAEGNPVPSRAASRDELLALAGCLADHEGTTLEFIVPGCINGFDDDEVELLAAMSRAANRPLNWNLLGVSSLAPDRCEHQLAASTVAAERGARVLALTLPHTMQIRLTFETGFVLDGLPGWRELFARPVAERMRVLSDADERRRLAELAASPEAGMLGNLARWERLELAETFSPDTKFAEGRRVGEVAAEVGKEPFDALCDILLADQLRTGLRPPSIERDDDWALRGEVWRDPRTVVGGSDAGAHLDMMCGAIYSTTLLGRGVREHQVITLEEAVHQLADVPARLYGLRDRGRIAKGCWADIVVFDLDRVAPGVERTRDDLPDGASRLVADADGIEHVLVSGREIVRNGAFTGNLPGHVLRSGHDSETVAVARSSGNRR